MVRLLKFGRLRILSVVEWRPKNLALLAPLLIGKVMREHVCHIPSRIRTQSLLVRSQNLVN